MRLFRVSMLVQLHQLEDEGTSTSVEALLEDTYQRFKQFLGESLFEYEAA